MLNKYISKVKADAELIEMQPEFALDFLLLNIKRALYLETLSLKLKIDQQLYNLELKLDLHQTLLEGEYLGRYHSKHFGSFINTKHIES
jgi:hypothetical protein